MPDEKNWKPLELVKVSSDYLESKNVPNARLDAEVLLVDVMGLKRRVDLYAGFEKKISGKELAAYRELIRRRAAREPVSRILGTRGFMGLDFAVTPDVLSPRPETELLVEAALEAVRPKRELPSDEPAETFREEAVLATQQDGDDASGAMTEELEHLLDSYAEDVDDEADIDASAPPPPSPAATSGGGRSEAADGASGAKKTARTQAAPSKAVSESKSGPVIAALDLGTGSGCIAISFAALCPGARVVAVDASAAALRVAERNALSAKVSERVQLRRGDWFSACRDGEKFDLIVSNPPYLVHGDPGIWPEVERYDPPTALYAGDDGLDCYRRIVPEAPAWLKPGGRIFLEIGAGQAEAVQALLRDAGFEEVTVVRDYGGGDRVAKGVMPRQRHGGGEATVAVDFVPAP